MWGSALVVAYWLLNLVKHYTETGLSIIIAFGNLCFVTKIKLTSLLPHIDPAPAPRTELSNVLAARQKGVAGPIKPRKEHKQDPNDGMSSELQKMLAKRNKIIEEVRSTAAVNTLLYCF